MTPHVSLQCTASHITAVICVIFLVLLIVSFSSHRGGSRLEWAYHAGDQPLYRLLFLTAIAVAAHRPSFFPVALLLTLLFMMINSMVPMLTELDETFVFGAPLTTCSAYNKKDVDKVGTPFYPINVVETAADNGGDGVGEAGDRGIPLGFT